MRKQKKPTGLIAGLVIFAAGAFGFNLYQSGAFKNIFNKQNTSAPQPGDAKAEDLADQASRAVKTAAKKNEHGEEVAEAITEEAPKADPKMMAAMKNKGGVPIIATPKYNAKQPEPNDSATATQWYRPESRKL
jgi:hypothetical protein